MPDAGGLVPVRFSNIPARGRCFYPKPIHLLARIGRMFHWGLGLEISEVKYPACLCIRAWLVEIASRAFTIRITSALGERV